jgi:hypothetical protein
MDTVPRIGIGETDFRGFELTRENLIDVSQAGERMGEDDQRSIIPVTEVLEGMDPSAKYKGTAYEGTDAFQRQLMRFGIRTTARNGRPASKMRAFVKNKDKAQTILLLPEFLSRTWKSVSYQADRARFEHLQSLGRVAPGVEHRFYQSNVPISDVLFPEALSLAIREKQIAPTMPLSMLVARTEPIDSGVYTAHRLTDDETERTLKRRSEGAELPVVRLTGVDYSYRPLKYGVVLKASYESVLFQRIDRFAFHLAKLAAQTEVDKVRTAIDVLVNGDGSASSAATNTNISALDALAGAGVEPTAKGYLSWRLLWTSPYNCNVIVARNEPSVQLLMANTGSANSLMTALWGTPGQVQFVNDRFGPVQVGTDDTYAPANKWLGLDNRFALEMVVVTGMEIVETDKLITSQMNVITFTEMLTFTILDVNGVVRTLTLNA